MLEGKAAHFLGLWSQSPSELTFEREIVNA